MLLTREVSSLGESVGSVENVRFRFSWDIDISDDEEMALRILRETKRLGLPDPVLVQFDHGGVLNSFGDRLKVELRDGRLVPIASAFYGSILSDSRRDDMYGMPPLRARFWGLDLLKSRSATGFLFDNSAYIERWSLSDGWLFLGWLYAKSLVRKENKDVLDLLDTCESFCDVYYNPRGGIASDARALCQVLSLHRAGLLKEASNGRIEYLRCTGRRDVDMTGLLERYCSRAAQKSKFGQLGYAR